MLDDAIERLLINTAPATLRARLPSKPAEQALPNTSARRADETRRTKPEDRRLMNTARHAHATGPSGVASWYVPSRADGFGDRLLMFDNTSTPSLELLRLRAELCATPGFEEALRSRVRQLASFRHNAFAPVRAVQYLDDGQSLALVSVHAAGQRLSELFDQQPRKGLNPAIVSWLLRELTPALADLQSHGDGIAHGALTPDRIILTPDGRLSIVEHVLGSALATLERSPSVLWREFSLFALPDGRGLAGADPRSDIAQLAGVALSMLLARPVTLFDLQHRVPALLDEFSELAAAPAAHHVSPLRLFLERALHVGGTGYESASDAQYDVRQLPSQSDIAAVVVPSSATKPTLRSVPRPEDDSQDSFLSETIEPAALPRQDAPRASGPRASEPRPSEPRRGDPRPSQPRRSEARASEPRASEPPASEPRRPPAPTSTPFAAPRDEPRRFASPASRTPAAAAVPTGAASAAVLPRAVAPAVAARVERGRGGLVVAMAAAIVAQSAVIGFLVTRPVPAVPASILIESAQPGDAVVVNGQSVGATPFELKVGSDLKSLRIVPPLPAAPAKTRATSGRRNTGSSSATKATSAAARAPMPAAAASRDGSVKLVSPIEMRISENGELLGSTTDGAIALSPGTHDLELANASLGYHGRQTVTIEPGRSQSVTLTPPDGLLSINALPGANCQIGTTSLGETPLANLKVPIGEHEVICRHPELGELRRSVTVGLTEVARLSLRFE